MPFFVDDQRHWRDRAEESRAIADSLADPAANATMLEIAAAMIGWPNAPRRAHRTSEPRKPQAKGTPAGRRA